MDLRSFEAPRVMYMEGISFPYFSFPRRDFVVRPEIYGLVSLQRNAKNNLPLPLARRSGFWCPAVHVDGTGERTHQKRGRRVLPHPGFPSLHCESRDFFFF